MTELAKPAEIVNNRPFLSSEGAPHMKKPETVWHDKICGLEPKMRPDTITDLLTDRRP